MTFRIQNMNHKMKITAWLSLLTEKEALTKQEHAVK